MYKFFPVIVVFNFSLIFNLEGSEITIESFIGKAGEDMQLKNQQEAFQAVEETSYETPYLDKIEFRTESDRFDLSRQEYSLRFYPKGFGESTETSMFNNLEKKSRELKKEVLLNSVLENRYLLILEYVKLSETLNLMEELVKIEEDRMAMLLKTLQLDVNADVFNLTQAEEKLLKIHFAITEHKVKKTQTEILIKKLSGSEENIFFEFDNLVKISEVKKTLADFTQFEVENTPKLQLLNMELQMAEVIIGLEKSKQKDYISYFSVGFDSSDYDKLKRAFSIGFGINLPFIQKNQENIRKRKISFLDEKYKLLNSKIKNNEELLLLVNLLKKLIEQYEILERTMTSGKTIQTFLQLQKLQGANPFDLLTLKVTLTDYSIKKIEIHFLILKNYIQFYSKLGLLSSKKEINFLLHVPVTAL